MYKRVLIKLSGETLSAKDGKGIDFDAVKNICEQIYECSKKGCQISIVVGGGNFWRGRYHKDMDHTTADHIGMLATTMNALALHDGFTQIGATSRVQTGIEMKEVAEFYIRDRAIKHLEKERIVIYGCGTGNPYFSTDTGAALRAAETNCDIILKATNVDGVYDKDPNKFADAKKFEEVSYLDVINNKLGVMDFTAITLCMDNEIPIYVFDINKKGNLLKVIQGENIGTIIK